MTLINTVNDYNMDVVSVKTRWDNWENKDPAELPILYVTNEGDDGDLRDVAKFEGMAHECPVDESINVSIIGVVRTPDEEIAEDNVDYLVQDIKKAVMVDPTLGLGVDLHRWAVRRSPPWQLGSETRMVQVLVTYRDLVNY